MLLVVVDWRWDGALLDDPRVVTEDFKDLFFNFVIVDTIVSRRSFRTFDHDTGFVSFDNCG
jgi:hypothetical protein